MSTYRVLLVDDEYLALDLLENYVRQVPDLEVVGRYKSPVAALAALQQQPVDLLFLDIQMPGLSGTNFLRTLERPPVTIFTTAYSQHAVEAFDLNAVDYLLKPFSFERFLQALNKARTQLERRYPVSPSPAQATMTVRVDGKLVRVLLDDILYIEGLKEYVRIVCANERLVTLERLKNLEDQLPADRFLRIHKSYIVAKDKVHSLEGQLLDVAGHRIPVSRQRREEVVAKLFGG